MNILILGGAGFLGSNLVRRCLKGPKNKRRARNKIVVVDSLEPRLKSTTNNLKEVFSSIKFIYGDIRNAALMKKVVKNQDAIFNCAGQTSHPLSLEDPLFDAEINSLGNLTVLEAVKKYNKKALVIYASSSTVVGGAIKSVIDETHPEFPLDIYSANKLAAEKYYYLYNKVYDLKTLILRFANLYGPYGKGYPEFGFVNYFISLAAKDKEITIYGKGSQSRNVMYVGDATELLYRCLSHQEIFGDIYFAVHRQHHSVLKVAKEIVSVFGKGKIVKIKWPAIRERIEIGKVKISGQKLYNKIKWEPKYNLKEGLIKTKQILDQSNL